MCRGGTVLQVLERVAVTGQPVVTMSHEEPGTPKARQALLHADLGAPPFKYVVGEEPVTPATTVLQPSETTARNQTSFNGASSTATRSEAKNHVALASREQSTAHTQQWGTYL